MSEVPAFCGFFLFDERSSRRFLQPSSANSGDFRSPTEPADWPLKPLCARTA